MTIAFTLDGVAVQAEAGETIWEAARRAGTAIPHLCHLPRPGYRPDGNCRACLVEIEGERVLAASCIRRPVPGMVVRSASARAARARRMVFELLLADQPEGTARDGTGGFAHWAERLGVTRSRFAPEEARPAPDVTHPAMAVNLDACIACGLCERACREVQHNDVIGFAHRGMGVRVAFDLLDAMGCSSCVGCGECVEACPTGALMAKSVADEAGRRRGAPAPETASVCPYCGVGCQLGFRAREGRIEEVVGRDGPANRGRLCVKGRFGFDYVVHPERLTRPLVRLEGAAKDPADCLDPARARAKFREADWEEALDRAAGGFAAIRSARGPSALAGFGSAKGSNEEAYLFQKLVRTGFGTNNVDHCTRLCHASSVAALLEGIGSGAVTAPFTAAAEADVILVIGARPTENHPVAATFLKDAAARGAGLIVMDPRGTGLDRFAEEVVRFAPGQDVALLNAMLHVVIAEGLHDRDFVARRLAGFEALAEHVRAYAPEAVEARCGVPAAQIRRVARRYARAERALILWGMGVSQSVHGTDNARALIALALVCGQVGRPGTGLHPLRGQNNVQGASDVGLIPMALPDYQRTDDDAARARLEALWGAPVPAAPGLTVVEITEAAGRGAIEGLYVMGENPAMSDPDLGHARAALARLRHLVVQDLFLTETAALADVVLPASAWPEKTGTVTNTNRQVQLGRAALAPPGEARQDLDIIVAMARRLGLGWRYGGPREVFAEMAQAMPSLANITWERLEREGSVTYPCHGPDMPGEGIIFHDAFHTADGRARLVPAGLSDPAELPDADFPFVLTTGRELEHWHTGAMTRRARVLDALRPAPVAALSPQAMRRLGLAPGARVRIATRRGAVECAAREDPALPEGMVFLSFAYREAPANMLTDPRLDPFGRIPGFKFSAARVGPA
ncbi:formate dehydrogenase subunit alpha [Roseomonas alkaliterrae]|uniref:Formate dehydrogenase major subunit n=1 Tax=Neoroseomonas alkaliterrae TaxID=1452450 RepID=A0A840Y0V9_9PROT|nr:formate dehydrogenase subunit alpha [Neoroseomonas alkaliterrae]MBB5690037.1 formate dehydrogenase major subunit [Neoroseomonas alkaliterrae]MBR0676752.1 formate dehydrogenase subunit alpha [Neoroseomonas alkaliterrae]